MKNSLIIVICAVVIVVLGIVLLLLGVFGGKTPSADETISVPIPVAENPLITPTVSTPFTPTNPSITTFSQPESETYTVKKGDTLWKIAKAKYGDGSKYKIIEEANKDKLSDAAKLKIGMVLLIPKLESGNSVTTPIETPKPSVKYHTVKKGDSLKKLALRYYQDSSKSNLIFEANRDKLATPETSLKTGWKLVIPTETPELPTTPVSPTPSGVPQ